MEINVILFILYCLIGIFAGLIGGLLGLGGGIIIVPALYFLFVWQGFSLDNVMHIAVATSLTTIIFTSISSSYAHHKRGAVLWPQVALLVPGIIIGAVIGAHIADALPSEAMRVGFGAFEILVAIQTWFRLKPAAQRSLPGTKGLLLIGILIGSLSTVLGIGGGTLTVPILLWCGINIRNAVATSSACGFPIALIATLTFIMLGWNQENLPSASLGYVYWPAALGISITSVLFAPLGARIAHKIPVASLQRIFAIVVFIVGVRILL